MRKKTTTLYYETKLLRILLIVSLALTSFAVSYGQSFNLTVETDETEGATVNPSGTFVVDQDAATPIEASAPEGYDFDGWTIWDLKFC